MRDTASRGITEQGDRITETKINVGVPRAKAVGLSGRVRQPWVLLKEAKRCKWVLKRPGDCGAQTGAREARRATELSLSQRFEWASACSALLSHICLRGKVPSLDRQVFRCTLAGTRDSQETRLTSTLVC